MEDIMTVQMVARELRVHQETVREKLRHGTLKGIKIGTYWRIRRQDFEEFIRKGGG